MIKRILVALDPDEDTPVATQYASEIAARYDGEVSGLAMVDVKQINSEVGGGAIGGLYYAEKIRTRLINMAHEQANVLTTTFDKSLSDADIKHDNVIQEGTPVRQITQEMKYHDMLVIGHTSHFLYNQPTKETNTLPRVVKQGVSPTLIVTDEYRPVSRIMIAYDGSDASARTLQRFSQLQPFGNDLEIYLVNVRSGNSAKDQHASDHSLNKATKFLKSHRFVRIVSSSILGSNISEKLLEHASVIQADLIVAGAHSVSALRRITFGSTTAALLSKSQVPLFLFH